MSRHAKIYLYFGVQCLVLLLCAGVIALFAVNFPFPSPVIKPFLAPEKRWPADQVRQWVKSGNVDSSFLAFFMRDPDRVIPDGAVIVAPADGKVFDIVYKPDWTYVVIALSYWDVHVQRSPTAGTVTSVKEGGNVYMNGEGIHLAFLPHKVWPVQKIIDLTTAWGPMRVRLVTSLTARRIRVWVHPGEKVRKGQRIGRILLGSTVVLQLPPDVPVAVHEGEHVTAGESIIFTGAGGA